MMNFLKRNVLATRKKGSARPGAAKGYTVVELLVVIGIATLLGTILLANTRTGGRTSDIDRAAQVLALDLRKAQALALSAKEEQQCSGNTVPYYGVRVRRQNNQVGLYELFADCNRNNRFDVSDVTLSQETMPNIEVQATIPNPASGWLEIVYIPPNPTVAIRRTVGTYTDFSIELRHLNDQALIRFVAGNDKGNLETQ